MILPAVQEAVSDLPPLVAEAVILRHCFGASWRTVADEQLVTVARARQRVRAGLLLLQESGAADLLRREDVASNLVRAIEEAE